MSETFSPDQTAILQAAFDHVWARMSALHNELNDSSERLVALCTIAVRKGLVADADELDATIGELTIEAAVKAARRRGLTENEITSRILGGDVDAFEDARAEEDDEDE